MTFTCCLFQLLQRIQFAKTKSDAVAKLDGSFKADKKSRSAKNSAVRGKHRRHDWFDRVHVLHSMACMLKAGLYAKKHAHHAALSYTHTLRTCRIKCIVSASVEAGAPYIFARAQCLHMLAEHGAALLLYPINTM